MHSSKSSFAPSFRSTVLALSAAAVASIACAVGFVYSGFYDVSATSGHNPAVAWVLHKTYEQSLHYHAKDVHVPADLLTSANIEAGAHLYQSTCVACHGAPGTTLGPIGQGILPLAPNLLGASRRNNPQLMYWVIRNGVKMTAMPSFGKTLNDQQLWDLAAFLYKGRGISAHSYAGLTSVNPAN